MAYVEKSCHSCGGSGKIQTRCHCGQIRSTDYDSCNTCNGKGYIESSCFACHGTGTIRVDDGKRESGDSSSGGSFSNDDSSSINSSMFYRDANPKAKAAKDSGNYLQAIDSYTDALENYFDGHFSWKPREIPIAYANRGGSYFSLGNREAAIADLKMAADWSVHAAGQYGDVWIDRVKQTYSGVLEQLNKLGISYGQYKPIDRYNIYKKTDPIYEEGVKNTKGLFKNHNKAVKCFSEAAALGHAEAMLQLSFAYENGNGVDKDGNEAEKWLRKAAENGCAKAFKILRSRGWAAPQVPTSQQTAPSAPAPQTTITAPAAPHKIDDFAMHSPLSAALAAQPAFISVMNMSEALTLGIRAMSANDLARAAEYFSKAAGDGETMAVYYLGDAYFDGKGVPTDRAKAVDLWLKAAADGLAVAMNDLGYAYREGEGVKRDYEIAAQFFHKGAVGGNLSAMNNIGKAFRDGMGVGQDFAKAEEWLVESIENGNTDSEAELALLRKMQANTNSAAPVTASVAKPAPVYNDDDEDDNEGPRIAKVSAGTSDSTNKFLYNNAMFYIEKGQFDQAAEILEKMAKSGHNEAKKVLDQLKREGKI
jgi:TPR repeat protein